MKEGGERGRKEGGSEGGRGERGKGRRKGRREERAIRQIVTNCFRTGNQSSGLVTFILSAHSG